VKELNLDEANIIVIDGDDLNELKQLEFDLLSEQGDLFKSISLAETQMEKIELKSRLTQIVSLASLCKDRQRELKDTNGRVNHNFKVIARKKLEKPTFKEIEKLARMKLSDAKELLKKESDGI